MIFMIFAGCRSDMVITYEDSHDYYWKSVGTQGSLCQAL